MANETIRPTTGTSANRDPLTGAPGAHPVGTAAGAVAGGIATGAAVGTVAGPVGTAIGAAVGAVVGGLAGKGIAEQIDPTVEDAYWRDNYSSRPYVSGGSYDDYGPAYSYGVNSYSKYAGRDFDDVESDLSRDWNSARGQVEPDLGSRQARDPRRLEPRQRHRRARHPRRLGPRRQVSGTAAEEAPFGALFFDGTASGYAHCPATPSASHFLVRISMATRSRKNSPALGPHRTDQGKRRHRAVDVLRARRPRRWRKATSTSSTPGLAATPGDAEDRRPGGQRGDAGQPAQGRRARSRSRPRSRSPASPSSRTTRSTAPAR